jgi:hypothetical protein
VSPIPILGGGGFPYFSNPLRKLAAGSALKIPTTRLSIFIMSKCRTPCTVSWSIISETVGPAVGSEEHPTTLIAKREAGKEENFIMSRKGFHL